MEKSEGGTFPLRLEIPQKRRDFHFYHRPGYDELTFRFHPKGYRVSPRLYRLACLYYLPLLSYSLVNHSKISRYLVVASSPAKIFGGSSQGGIGRENRFPHMCSRQATR